MAELLVIAGVTLVLLALNGFFVAAEFALLASPLPRLERLAAEGVRWAARLRDVVQDPVRQDRYVATAQIGITVASLGLGMYGEHAMAGWLAPHLEHLGNLAEPTAHTVAGVLAVLGLTYLHIVLGEMVAKSLALQAPVPTARVVMGPMIFMQGLLTPFILLLNGIGNVILRLLGLPVEASTASTFTVDELRLVFEESRREGFLQEREHDLVQNLISFSERTARQVMVGRTRVAGLRTDCPVNEALKAVKEEGFTRYPVYREDMDHVEGMVHVKDLFLARTAGRGTEPVAAVARKIPFVPESMGLQELLRRMRDQRAQMAVVVEEHGGTAGIVTIEDLVEEIFGEVRDEFDLEEEDPLVPLPDGSLRVRGSVLLEDLSEELNRPLEAEEVETVSGLVLDRLGRPPRVGDRLTVGAVELEVLAVEDMVPAKVRARALPLDEAQNEPKS